ncbi:hypothetical protein FR483_n294R [Paramecium bursaria Chlorella virus FR483]|uniref:Uncharacterized protein n294R n=1 Tax=Paramecium bursaria Chlorella virus FR483 TaxID=399781 RepID=A7J6Z8_PBCVF|nr:hypothetical protein FR483_n294R [Paramecium bursaria Chlorella virus FR483]ABT15579.1 hypothetical protein FR483_n294R [Paramecium bursaria Chlorella virus FR483]
MMCALCTILLATEACRTPRPSRWFEANLEVWVQQIRRGCQTSTNLHQLSLKQEKTGRMCVLCTIP